MLLAPVIGLRHADSLLMFIWAIFLETAFLLALGGVVLGLIH